MKRSSLALTFCCAALWLGGCSTAPPVAPERIASSPGSEAALERVGMPLRWWEGLDDPALTQLLDLAVDANLDLAQAAERIREQRAARRVAAADLFPSASLRATDSNDARGWYGLDLAWELDLFGRLGALRNAAGAQLQASVHDYQALRLSLMSEVAATYLQLRLAQRQLDLASQTSAAQAETARVTQARLRRGMASRLDTERMETLVNVTQAEIPAARQQAAAARLALGYLLATELATIDRIVGAARPVPQAPRNGAVASLFDLPMDLLRQRPDVLAAQQRLYAADKTLAAQRAARFPQITLSALGGFESGGADAASWSLSGQLLQPLFDAGRISARIEGADARLKQSRQAYEAALRQALRDAQSAIHGYGQGLERQQRFDQAASAAERAVQLARRQYQAGTIALLDVLDAERSLFDIQRQQAQAATEASLRWIDIYRTLGVGPMLPDETGKG